MTQAHTTPFHGRELSEYIVKVHGGVHTRTTGSHKFFRLPNGGEVGSVKDTQIVTARHARNVADILGMTYRELREDIGFPVPKAGGALKHKPRARTEKRTVTKGQVTRVATGMRDDITDLLKSLAGDRDPQVYADLFESLKPAAAHIAKALNDSTKRGAA